MAKWASKVKVHSSKSKKSSFGVGKILTKKVGMGTTILAVVGALYIGTKVGTST